MAELEKQGEISVRHNLKHSNRIEISPEAADKVKKYLDEKYQEVSPADEDIQMQKQEEKTEKQQEKAEKKEKSTSTKPKKDAQQTDKAIKSAKDLARAEGPVKAEGTKSKSEEKDTSEPAPNKKHFSSFVVIGAGALLLGAIAIWYMKHKRDEEKKKKEAETASYKGEEKEEPVISNLERLRQSYTLRPDER
jgi:cobalamin biosynthesis Mg chelatase CobN